jgi:DNA-binding NarL/FixJ family response regulator
MVADHPGRRRQGGIKPAIQADLRTMRSSYGSHRQSASSGPLRVLLIEDMETTVAIVRAYLAAVSSSSLVESAGTLGAALQMLERGEFDLVIADLNLPDCQGIETLERLVKETESLIVVLTIEESPQLREAAFALGAYDFLQKSHLSKAVLGRIVRLATLQANTFRSLRESEARFRSLTELSSDFYWETDASHRLVWTSHGDRHRPFGAPGVQIGKTPWETPSVSPDEAGWAAHRATLDAHQLFRGFEISRLDESGAERHTSVSGEPLFDDNGVFSGYRGGGGGGAGDTPQNPAPAQPPAPPPPRDHRAKARRGTGTALQAGDGRFGGHVPADRPREHALHRRQSGGHQAAGVLAGGNARDGSPGCPAGEPRGTGAILRRADRLAVGHRHDEQLLPLQGRLAAAVRIDPARAALRRQLDHRRDLARHP